MNKLPININDLINARTVEWERLEFKEGWNPEDVLNKRYAYYIRKASETVIAKTQDEKELFELASKIPFDDRMHHTATIKDLDLGLMRGYLQQVKSDLFSESSKMG